MPPTAKIIYNMLPTTKIKFTVFGRNVSEEYVGGNP